MTTAFFGSNPKLIDGRTMPISKAVRAGDFVFVSGQVPFGPDGSVVSTGFEQQVRQVFDNLKSALSMADCGLEDVVKCNVWLEDVRNFDSFNRIYGEFFAENPPARSVVHSVLMANLSVEIEATAYKPS